MRKSVIMTNYSEKVWSPNKASEIVKIFSRNFHSPKNQFWIFTDSSVHRKFKNMSCGKFCAAAVNIWLWLWFDKTNVCLILNGEPKVQLMYLVNLRDKLLRNLILSKIWDIWAFIFFSISHFNALPLSNLMTCLQIVFSLKYKY